jgi:hypothetical protein
MRKQKKLGLRASDTCQIALSQVLMMLHRQHNWRW